MSLYSRISLFFVLFLFILSSCKLNKDVVESDQIIIEEEPYMSTGKVRVIFYNMDLPTEMARLFERVGANYTPKILNSSDNFSRYDEKSKLALNIGLYGVDLSYCRIFSQNAAIAKYFSTIQLMFEKLGIPDDYFNDLVEGMEKYSSDRDTLSKFASDVYNRADNYLRENEYDDYAAMIVTGGWVESLYLACKIAENNPENIEIIQRIAGQKYSLNSLISLLSNYQENIVIAENILKLKGLKKAFDKFNIYYKQDNFQVDTVNKLISSSEYEINLSAEILKEIDGIISEIRLDVVN
jgi:hypothetical protein